MKILTPGTISKLLGLPRHIIYYREETGQIPPARRTATGKRFYTESDLKRLRKIIRRGGK